MLAILILLTAVTVAVTLTLLLLMFLDALFDLTGPIRTRHSADYADRTETQQSADLVFQWSESRQRPETKHPANPVHNRDECLV